MIQFQSKGVQAEEEQTESRAETVLELWARPALRAGHQRTARVGGISLDPTQTPSAPGSKRAGVFCDVVSVPVRSGKGWLTI